MTDITLRVMIPSLIGGFRLCAIEFEVGLLTFSDVQSSIYKLLIVACMWLSCNSHAGTFIGRVVGIADGDTITVLDADKVQHRIRLTGIDAPEKKQPFGNRSKQNLSDMVFNKTVTVDTDKRDRYGRELGKVLTGGKDVNLEQVRAGMAWHYKAYERTQSATDRQAYADAENDAKAAKRGLWVNAEPVPPWEWRHSKH